MSLRFSLVPPAVWRPLVRDWFGTLPDHERQLAASILVGLHDRHIGITPRLSAGLARSLISGEWTRPWDAAIERLRRDHAEHGEQPLIPERAFDFVVYHMVGPLIRLACEELGECLLFAEDAVDAPIRADAYAEYEQNLLSIIGQLVVDDGRRVPALFWRERALRLAAVRGFAPQPDFDMLDLAVFFELRPAMRERRENAFNLFIPQEQHLRDERRQGAGADGLMLTRREEDIQRMHLTEHLYPEPLRMDRVLNTGYAIVKPPPQPVRQRDVLLVTMCYGGVADVFLKTCFADFALFVSRMLPYTGGNQFRWIEGDRFGRVRSQHTLLHDLSRRLPVEIAPANLPDYRLLFLESAGWLPGYLDHAAPMFTPPEMTDSGVAAWLRSVWQQHIDSLQTSPPDAPQIRLGDYHFIHLLLCLPARLQSDDSYQTQRIRDLFGGDLDSLCITWVPDDIRDSEDWSVVGGGRHWQPAPGTDQLRLIGGGLVDAWLDAMLYEMRHV